MVELSGSISFDFVRRYLGLLVRVRPSSKGAEHLEMEGVDRIVSSFKEEPWCSSSPSLKGEEEMELERRLAIAGQPQSRFTCIELVMGMKIKLAVHHFTLAVSGSSNTRERRVSGLQLLL